jgi:hypothetical protein
MEKVRNFYSNMTFLQSLRTKYNGCKSGLFFLKKLKNQSYARCYQIVTRFHCVIFIFNNETNHAIECNIKNGQLILGPYITLSAEREGTSSFVITFLLNMSQNRGKWEQLMA